MNIELESLVWVSIHHIVIKMNMRERELLFAMYIVSFTTFLFYEYSSSLPTHINVSLGHYTHIVELS